MQIMLNGALYEIVDTGPLNAVAVNLAADTVPSPSVRGIYVGTTGNLKVDMVGGQTGVTFQNVSVGYFAGHFSKIYSTANGTTASNLVAVW
jgi:hypothetical protein